MGIAGLNLTLKPYYSSYHFPKHSISSFLPKISNSKLGFPMTLLELITKATTDPETVTPQSNHPIIFNSDDIFRTLKPTPTQSPHPQSLLQPIQGWTISDTDTEITNFGNDFCNKLKRKLKSPNSFTKDEFLKLFNSFLEKNRERFNLFVKIDAHELIYTNLMLKKLWYLITPNIGSLVLEACLRFEGWDLVETLIVEGGVGVFSSRELVGKLVEKRKSDLVCLCVRHFKDVEASDVCLVLKYFLSPPKGAYDSMVGVRKKWDREALNAVKKVGDDKLSVESLGLAKEAAVLLMMAYDEFSPAEVCLHYLFASSVVDELTLLFSLSELNGLEVLKLIRYFGKWLRKYLRFSQAGPCPEAAKVLGLQLCKCVPSLDSIVKYLGAVLDDQFSSLLLNSELHDELRSLDEDVKSLALEARFCCSLAGVVDNLKLENEL